MLNQAITLTKILLQTILILKMVIEEKYSNQVEAEYELRGCQGFRSWARIWSHSETTDHSWKLASALVCRWRRSGHVTRSSAWLTWLRNIEHVSAIRNWQIFWCASRPASTCRSGGHHLGKFAWGSNLALVFEAVHSRPSATFPDSWHDYWKQYFRSFGWRICLPNSPKWRYRQNYDVNKWHVWIGEAFLSQISASPGATDGWHCWQNIPNL